MLTKFTDILGNENALAELRLSLQQHQLNHAYLFEGASGTGKYTLAQALAARFLCASPAENEACGNCQSCKLFAENNHPDFLELPRTGRNLSIAHFVEREGDNEKVETPPVLSFMRYTPLLQNGRVCIIPAAERMHEAAANAFLKTLEEPPPHSLFILTTTARERLISTIISRCRRVLITPLSATIIQQEMARRLQREIPLTQAELAEGSLGNALNFADEDALADWQTLNDFWRDFTPAQAVTWAENLIENLSNAKDAENKRQVLFYWLNLSALKIRRLLRHHKINGNNAAHALESLWTAGERLTANVRPELVALTSSIEVFAAIR